MLKRAFDFIAALCGLLLLWPVILICVVIIRRGSEGPGVFSQVRVGRHGRPFRCHKLRTMYIGAPSAPTHEVASSTVTPLGHKLRRTKLDELPQLMNVLVGDMSLVGPRPCLPTQEELVALRREKGVLEVRPGITGLAQIRDIDMSNPSYLSAVDAEYVRTASFCLDLRIILATVLGGAGRDDRIRSQGS